MTRYCSGVNSDKITTTNYFQEWKKEQEEEMRIKMAQSGRYKQVSYHDRKFGSNAFLGLLHVGL